MNEMKIRISLYFEIKDSEMNTAEEKTERKEAQKHVGTAL